MSTLVVTPTLGISPWLRDTISSVAAFRCCKHVLVAPPNVASTLARQFPLKHILAENDSSAGMYAAVNLAAKTVTEWDSITYINDDDLLLPAFSQVLDAVSRASKHPLIAYGRVRIIDSKDRKIGTAPASPWPWLNEYLYAQRVQPLYQQGTLITRTAFSQLGGFDDSLRLCGDLELLARACKTGIPFKRVTKSDVAAFRWREGQLSKDRVRLMREVTTIEGKLHLKPERLSYRHRTAKIIFRLSNIDVYIGRLRRQGRISQSSLSRLID